MSKKTIAGAPISKRPAEIRVVGRKGVKDVQGFESCGRRLHYSEKLTFAFAHCAFLRAVRHAKDIRMDPITLRCWHAGVREGKLPPLRRAGRIDRSKRCERESQFILDSLLI
jgi:hypothetical protein